MSYNRTLSTSIVFLAWLCLASCACAGQFYITNISAWETSNYGDSGLVVASTRAQFRGTVDWDDKQWQISTSIRPAGGTWHTGSPNFGSGIEEGMEIECSYTSCGGSANIDHCNTAGTNFSYTYKGAVAISHSATGNQTDSQVAIGYQSCPVSSPDPAPDNPLEDGCTPP